MTEISALPFARFRNCNRIGPGEDRHDITEIHIHGGVPILREQPCSESSAQRQTGLMEDQGEADALAPACNAQHFKARAHQHQAQRLFIEEEIVRGVSEEPPPLSGKAAQQAVVIAGAEDENAVRVEQPADVREREVRAVKVFDGVPKSHYVEQRQSSGWRDN